MTLGLSGTDDWDKTIFDLIDSGDYTAAQGQWLWDYSDGWKATLAATSTSATPARSYYCLKKTGGTVSSAKAGDGLFCFSIGGSDAGVTQNIAYLHLDEPLSTTDWTTGTG